MIEDHKVNILMVDDQPAKLLSYEVILSELGENLLKASSADEALHHLLRNDVAVVLMDVSMPGIDGFELADMIRQHPRFSKTAMIFISGVHFSDADKINAYRRGAVDYISVPVVPEVLRAKVSVFVELHRKTRLLEQLNAGLERRVEERARELRQSETEIGELNRELQRRIIELRERAELLELASEAIMVHDMDGKIQFWNSGAEEVYGWRREQAAGNNVHQLLSTCFPVPYPEIQEALMTRGAWEGNLVHRKKDGSEVVVSSRMAFNRERSVILEINRDITERKQAEEALRQAEKFGAMGRVAGIIAHEINNPLEAITNLFFLLRQHPSLDDQARRYAELAEQELARVSHITRQTLSFYRDSKQPIAVSICEVLDNILELQMRHLHMNRVTVEKRYRADGAVHGYPVELRQVFLNLISNAVQAMAGGGTLRVRVRAGWNSRKQREGLRISVVDTGCGIRKEDAKHLFEPFFSTKAGKGTGLGLWITKGILQKYDGSIRSRSVFREGKATTCFAVFLPASVTAGAMRATAAVGEQDVSVIRVRAA